MQANMTLTLPFVRSPKEFAMCPIDPTPHFGEVRQKPQKQFPKPTPDVNHEDKPQADEPQASELIADRPEIPDSSEVMAVDIEDEDADPVVESGPGLDKRQTSLFTRD